MPKLKATLLNKNEAAKNHGAKVFMDAKQYVDIFKKMSLEELYDFIMRDHSGAFRAPDGRPMREKILEDSWSAISSDPNLPATLKAYWSRIPADERGKKIVNYLDAMNKLGDYLTVAMVVILNNQTAAAIPVWKRQILPAIKRSYDAIAQGLSDGQYFSNERINEIVTAQIASSTNSVDRNSEEFAVYTNVLQAFDPKYNTWISC